MTSSLIGVLIVKPPTHPAVAPQYDLDNITPPPVFSLPPILPVIKKTNFLNDMKDYDYVPLKSDQYNSRPEGAMVLNAPIAPYMARLDVPRMSAITSTIQLQDLSFKNVATKFAQDFDYNAGIRPSVRELKLDDVNEPSGTLFRKVKKGKHSFPTTTYDEGNIELKYLQGIGL